MEEEDGILLSEKYGLNPSIEKCALCNKDMGLILCGLLGDDVEAPKTCCLGHLCEECKKDLEKYKEIIFLEINNNMYTGSRYLMPEYYINPNVLNDLNGERIVYVSKKTFDDIKQNIKELEEEQRERDEIFRHD